MSIINEYYMQAELAQAAYANLKPGVLDDLAIIALQNEGGVVPGTVYLIDKKFAPAILLSWHVSHE